MGRDRRVRVVLTGSSGRVGRAIYGALAADHAVTGIDRVPFSTTHITGDLADEALLRRAMEGADAVIHAAGPHAPHVGVLPDAEFERINVEGTRLVAEAARASGVARLVYTSTTALYGAVTDGPGCAWIDEDTPPRPRTIYHRTKLAAEDLLAGLAGDAFNVRILRMSRCFPEPADIMAAYRLHRGIDARDVADAHVAALADRGAAFLRHVVSGATPFVPEDREMLGRDAPAVLAERAPDLVRAFEMRGWRLPATIDRVYAPGAAAAELGWQPRFGFEEVIAQLDRRSLEVLPPGARIDVRAE